MSRFRVLLSGLVCLLLGGLAGPAIAGALGVSVNRNSIDRFDETPILIGVFGLSGPEAHIRLFADLDGDGNLDPEDTPVWSTILFDNGTPWSPVMPVDTNLVPGTIVVELRAFGALGFPHTAGRYIWQAEDPGVNSVITSFTVTEAAEVETVAGQVVEAGSGTPIPGALVVVSPLGESCRDTDLSAFADTNGNFVINVPPGIPCRNRLALALRPGYLTNFLTASVFVLSGNPVGGLTVELETAARIASGAVHYSTGPRAGLGVPGQFVVVESDTDGTFAAGFTDTDGTFEVSVADGDWVADADNGLQLALQGAVGRDDAAIPFSVSGGPAAIPALDVAAANAAIRGELRDELLSGLAARQIESSNAFPCDPECYSTATLTNSDGSFVLGVLAPAGPDDATWTSGPVVPLDGRIAQQSVVTLSQGNDVSGANIDHLTPDHFISGTFSDSAGDPVGDLCIDAATFGPELYVARGRVGCDGTYSIPVVDGTWEVAFEESDVAGLVRNFDPSGFRTQIVIAGADEQLDVVLGPSELAPAIVRVLPTAAVAGQHVVLEGFNLSRFGDAPIVTVEDIPATVVATRADIGRLVFAMPSGAADGAVQVRVEDPGTGLVSGPACMEMLSGSFAPACSISGNVTIDQGSGALAGATVVALDEATEELARVAVTDAAGNYSLDLADDTATYSLLYIPPASTFRVWGEQSGVACPAVQDRNIRTGRPLAGRVVDPSGEGIANVFVDAAGELAEASVLTDDGGNWQMRLWEDDTIDVRFFAPVGSRFVNDQFAQVVMTSPVVLPDTTLSPGSLFAGRTVDAIGAGFSTEIAAEDVATGAPSGRTFSDTCGGSFGLALAPGQHALRIRTPSGDRETVVESVPIAGDTFAEFDFAIFDDEALQLTGPEPRINDESDFAGRPGQPIVLGVENLGPTGVEAIFSDDVSGTGTAWDPGRGVVVTRVPAGAQTGDLRVEVDGSASAPIPFTVEPDAYDPGDFTISGSVTDGVAPVADALVAVFVPESSATGGAACGDDVTFHEYAVTDAAGAYSVQHPGGRLFLLVWPPVSGGLALSAQEFVDETANRSGNDVVLGAGAALGMRLVTGSPPVPVPNAVVVAEGDYLDLRMTDANGETTFHVPAGPVDLEFRGPLGSRLLEEQLSTLVPGALGDVPLTAGVFVGGGAAEDDGTPLTGLETDGFSTTNGRSYFFTRTRDDGVWRGPVAGNETWGVSLRSGRDDLGDFSFGMGGRDTDWIGYPSARLEPAGTLSGTVVDAETGTPLPGLGIGTFFDEGGFPGAFFAGGQTCDDGAYRIKHGAGAYFVGALPGFVFPDLFEGYYSPSTPGDFCFDDAEPVTIVAGADTPNVDIALDARSIITGRVSVYDVGEPDVPVTTTLGRLGTCTVTGLSGPDGQYFTEVPASAGYRVESQAPPSIGGPSQCFAGNDGCASFDPVTTEPLLATTGIDFIFGFPPTEVSATSPPLTLDTAGDDDVTLTFEMLPPEVRGDAYNVYFGSLDDFGDADMSFCLQVPASLVDNLDGTFSKTVTTPGDGWFLVSASNVIGEGPLGQGRALSDICGVVPPAKRGVPKSFPFTEPRPVPVQREQRRPGLRWSVHGAAAGADTAGPSPAGAARDRSRSTAKER